MMRVINEKVSERQALNVIKFKVRGNHIKKVLYALKNFSSFEML